MKISAAALGQMLDGTVEGNPEITVSAPSKIEEGRPGTISFLANPKYEAYAYTTQASILLVSRDFKPAQPIAATLIRVDNVYASITHLLEQFGKDHAPMGGIAAETAIAETAHIGNNVTVGMFAVVQDEAVIGENTIIYPQVFIGKGAKVGKNVILHPGVKIYHGCEVGDNCILHANVVVGADGFGFLPDEKTGKFKKIPQIGNVIIEKDVEIGSNTVIDRATMGSTVIKAGVKLDNLIQIAHNVEIGENTAIAAQAGIAGSTKIGKNCLIGGQSGFVGHITVADGTRVQAQSGIAGPIEAPGQAFYGSPAIPYTDYLRAYAVFKQLPELNKEMRRLKKELEELRKSRQ